MMARNPISITSKGKSSKPNENPVMIENTRSGMAAAHARNIRRTMSPTAVTRLSKSGMPAAKRGTRAVVT